MRLAFLFVAAAALTACGPKATEADCQQLADYTVKMGLAGSNTGISVEAFKQSEPGKKAIQSIMKDCVGQISQSDLHKMLDCLKQAGDDPEKMAQCAK